MELVGIREVDFERNGDHIRGTRLYFCFESAGVNGLATESIFVSDRIILPPLQLGSHYDILYNKFGKIRSIVEQ